MCIRQNKTWFRMKKLFQGTVLKIKLCLTIIFFTKKSSLQVVVFNKTHLV